MVFLTVSTVIFVLFDMRIRWATHSQKISSNYLCLKCCTMNLHSQHTAVLSSINIVIFFFSLFFSLSCHEPVWQLHSKHLQPDLHYQTCVLLKPPSWPLAAHVNVMRDGTVSALTSICKSSIWLPIHQDMFLKSSSSHLLLVTKIVQAIRPYTWKL